MNRPFKTIRHLLLQLATAAAALCPGEAWADQVMYIEPNEYVTTVSATKITSATTSISTNENYDVYYFVEGDVTIDNLTITGSRNNDNVFIILCDDATLTINGQINCSCHLRFCAQSTGSHRGKVIATSAADDAIYGYYVSIEGGDVIVKNGGIKGDDISLHHGHLTADRLIANSTIDINAHNLSFSFKANEYITPLLYVVFSIMADGETQIAKGGYHGNAGDSYSAYSAFKGKTLTVDPANLYNVTIDPTITGGTVTTNKAQAVANEYVYVTFTPATGYMLTSASRTPEGGTTKYADATELATAQSTGKWAFSQNSKSNVTVSATFAPIVASITSGGTTTYFATIADAFDAVADGETIVIQRDDIDESADSYVFSSASRDITIDMNGHAAKFCSFSNKYGDLTITDTSPGHTGKAEFVSIENMGDVTIQNVAATFGRLANTSVNSDHTLTFNGATVFIDNNDDMTSSLEWSAKHILLTGGSTVTVKNGLWFGGGDGDATFGFDDDDTKSVMHLVNSKVSGYDEARAVSQIRARVGLDKLAYYDEKTAARTAVTLDLRRKWTLDLKNAFNEISAGVPSATVTYFDAVPTFNPADPTTFNPADYVPAGETGANEITAINNSDGQDHYIIMHIVPHKGDIADPDDPDYWTNERLLYVMEGASAASRSRGPGISLNLPYLLKADEYDANLDPTDPDIQPRHDGAGWYYYKLPALHCAANGYTKSTLQGLAAPVFDMDAVSLAQDLETGVVTLSRTTDSWTAELTYDRLHWPFTGTIDDTDKPILKKLVMKYGGSSLITLDTTPASENPSDEAKAAAAQAEINAQITHNYPYPVSRLEWNQQQIGSATAFGWFQGTNYSTDSYFWIDVPFTPLDPTEATYPAGTANNPWLIQNGEDLSMLAKCVNIGSWTAHDRYLRQSADIDLAAEGVTDFEPIASTGVVGLGFEGHYDGFGKTISHIDYECTRLPDLDGTKCFVGLFGHLFGMDDRPGWVKNVTLKDCEFKAAAGSCAVAVGTIAGYLAGHSASAMTISNCKVLGSTVVSGLPANCGTGAIVGHCDYTAESNNSLANNYYGYNVSVTNDGGTATGYTPRGYSHGLVFDADADAWTYEWRDVTDNNGAKLWVKKATPPAANANGSTVAFSQTTTPALADATHPADCYNISGTDYYYAVDQLVTLSVTTGSASPDGVRTFYDELEELTVTYDTTPPGTTTPVTTVDNITATLSFAMPVADATIAATFKSSDWFTINTVNYNATDPSQPNAYNWMTFYHEWENENDQRDYIVSNFDDPTKAVEVKTVSRVDPANGTFALADIDGNVCFYGVPTIFHYAEANDASAVLPQKLKFTLVDPNDPQAPAGGYTMPTVASQFQGTVSDKTLTASDKCYILNNAGDFILAYPTEGDDQIAAHKSYIDLSIEDNGNTQAPARLVSVGDETGIGSMVNGQCSMDNLDGPWYSLDGRQLNGQPTRKGIYIYKGKKTVVK
jgi:hypothetical protein